MKTSISDWRVQFTVKTFHSQSTTRFTFCIINNSATLWQHWPCEVLRHSLTSFWFQAWQALGCVTTFNLLAYRAWFEGRFARSLLETETHSLICHVVDANSLDKKHFDWSVYSFCCICAHSKPLGRIQVRCSRKRFLLKPGTWIKRKMLSIITCSRRNKCIPFKPQISTCATSFGAAFSVLSKQFYFFLKPI